MNPKHTSPQVTLEQLLRLKRAERPDPEFWQQFERDLHIKQLAAIVEPRPWWAPFIRISAQVGRFHMPVGATAILALTFITVQEYQLPEVVDAQFSSPVVQTKIDTMPGPSVAVVMPQTQTAIEQNETAVSDDAIVLDSTAAPENVQSVASVSMTPDQVSEMMPMLSGGAHIEENYSPAARMIAANMEAVRASDPDMVHMIERSSGMEALLSPRTKTQAEDPLARVRTPRVSSRSGRLLASSLSSVKYAPGNTEAQVSSSRINRSLTEDRLYDSISRFGVKADRVAIKF